MTLRAFRLPLNWLVGLLFLSLLLIFEQPALELPFHWDGIGELAPAADEMLRNGFDPISRTPETIGIHPPLLRILLAMTWAVFGRSLLISHLLILVFAFLTVYYTWRLSNHLYREPLGLMAGLLLLFTPVFLAQSGIIYYEVPLAAFTTASVYYAITKNEIGYIIFASLAALTKVYGGVIVLAVLVYVLLEERKKHSGKQKVIERLGIHSIPLFVMAIWGLYHWSVTGWAFIPSSHVGIYASGIGVETGIGVVRTLYFMFFAQYRWILTLIIFCALVRSLCQKRMLRRREAWVSNDAVLLLIPIGLYIALLLIAYLPRYLVPVLPCFFLIGTKGIADVFHAKSWLIATGILGLFTIGWIGMPLGQPLGDMAYCIPSVVSLVEQMGFTTQDHFEDILIGKVINAETDSDWMDLVRTHQAAANYLEQNHRDAIILAAFPQIGELTVPAAGYVEKPLQVQAQDNPDQRRQTGLYDLVYYSPQSTWHSAPLNAVAGDNLRLLQRFVRRDKMTEIYQVIP